LKYKIRKNYRKARYIVYKETLIDPIDHLWTFIGGFLGIGLIGIVQSYLKTSVTDNFFLIGSFGASAVLVYGIPNSPLAQPRNLIGGHVVSALVGVTAFQLLGWTNLPWLAPAVALSSAIVAMQITKTLHPPGGATALIATIGSEKIKALEYMYVIAPVFVGASFLFLIAMLINNIPAHRHYPQKKK
jgi:CBS domain-containing membrane protein